MGCFYCVALCYFIERFRSSNVHSFCCCGFLLGLGLEAALCVFNCYVDLSRFLHLVLLTIGWSNSNWYLVLLFVGFILHLSTIISFSLCICILLCYMILQVHQLVKIIIILFCLSSIWVVYENTMFTSGVKVPIKWVLIHLVRCVLFDNAYIFCHLQLNKKTSLVVCLLLASGYFNVENILFNLSSVYEYKPYGTIALMKSRYSGSSISPMVRLHLRV